MIIACESSCRHEHRSLLGAKELVFFQNKFLMVLQRRFFKILKWGNFSVVGIHFHIWDYYLCHFFAVLDLPRAEKTLGREYTCRSGGVICTIFEGDYFSIFTKSDWVDKEKVGCWGISKCLGSLLYSDKYDQNDVFL